MKLIKNLLIASAILYIAATIIETIYFNTVWYYFLLVNAIELGLFWYGFIVGYQYVKHKKVS